MKEDIIPIQDEIVLYQSEDGNVKVDVLFQDETVWLTQEQMAQLFGKGRTTITEHIGNIFKEGELDEEKVCRKFRHTTQHGAIEGLSQTQEVKYYNLDVIISVGYRVKSRQGTMFRIWATQRLHDYIIRGYALNEERFKKGNSMNYFRELIEKIREIRLEEKIFYQQIKDFNGISEIRETNTVIEIFVLLLQEPDHCYVIPAAKVVLDPFLRVIYAFIAMRLVKFYGRLSFRQV